MTLLTRNGRDWRSLTLALALMLPGLAHPSDQFGSAYSGLNHFIPVHARVPLYKLKAQQNQIREKAKELREQNPAGRNSEGSSTYYGAATPGSVFSSCSVNIGNITPGTGANGFGSKETIVLIEGDVINVADCSN